MRPSQDAQPSALVIASCPELVAMATAADGTVDMGTLAAKAAELGGQYRECRAAALGNHSKSE